MTLDLIAQFIEIIEGPYKWIILVVGSALISAFFTRFVFKTLKWVIIAVIAAGIVLVVLGYLSPS